MTRTHQWILLTTMAAAACSDAGAAVFTIGSDPSCTHATIEDALAAAAANGSSADEIRLPAGTLGLVAGPLNVDAQSITLAGGYAACTDPAPSGRTALSNALGTLHVHALSGTPIALTLSRLDLSASTARVIDIDGPATVALDASTVSGGRSDNQDNSSYGTGVRLRGAGALQLGGGSRVFDNTAADRGGGVYCDGGGTVHLAQGAAIDSNHSGGDGGGVYLDHCTLDDASGGAPFAGGTFAGIVGNTAVRAGGGVYAINATLTSSGTTDRTLVADNVAHAGAGLYVTGADSLVELVNTSLERNNASGNGGALYVTAGANVTMGRYSVDCSGQLFCARIVDNAAASGSILYADGGAKTKLAQIELRSNPPGGTGSAIDTRGTDTFTLVEGAVLYGHAPRPASYTESGAGLKVAFVSSYANAGAFSIGVGGSVGVYSSVIEDEVFLPAQAITNDRFADCVTAKEIASIPVGLDGIEQLDDPVALFKNPSIGDLRPRPHARSIDRCDTFFYPPTTLDVFGFQRGFDVPSVTNSPSFGPIDQGAVEAPWLFADDFDG